MGCKMCEIVARKVPFESTHPLAKSNSDLAPSDASGMFIWAASSARDFCMMFLVWQESLVPSDGGTVMVRLRYKTS